ALRRSGRDGRGRPADRPDPRSRAYRPVAGRILRQARRHPGGPAFPRPGAAGRLPRRDRDIGLEEEQRATQTQGKTNEYWAQLEEMDRGSILHPFTVLKDFAEGRQRPRIVTGGKGVFIRDQDGRELLDGFAGLYCVNIGYGRPEVAEAIARQAHELAYYHSYAGVSSEALIRLSDRLVKMAPGGMSKVFYGLSGSDANETQAKLVWYYNNILGRPQKKKIIARERGYHG